MERDDDGGGEHAPLTLAEAAERTGFGQKYLRVAIARGHLRAEKDGHRWSTTEADLDAFLHREPESSRGRGQKRRREREGVLRQGLGLRDLLTRPGADLPFKIPPVIATRLALLHAARRLRAGARGGLSPVGEPMLDTEIPFGTGDQVSAATFLQQTEPLVARMIGAPDDNFELLIRCGDGKTDPVAMTRTRFEQLLGVVRARSDEGNGGTRDFERRVRATSRPMDIGIGELRQDMVGLVLVPYETYRELSEYLYKEIVRWYEGALSDR